MIARAMRLKSQRAACSRRSASTDPLRGFARMTRMRCCALVLLVACSSPPAPAPATAPADPTGPFYDPARDAIPVVDSHVHLAFYPVADQLASHGVRAA